MTIKQSIKQLEASGYIVTYKQRYNKKGIKKGILITSINGRRFTGSKGNVEARNLLGITISTKAQTQLTRIQIAKRKPELSSEIRKQILKTQKAWRKGTHGTQGKITTKRVRRNIELYGEEQTLKSLKQQERYSKGYAYEENIDHLIDRLTPYLPYTKEIIDLINSKRARFRDEWIADINEIFYQVDQGKLKIESAIQQVKTLIK